MFQPIYFNDCKNDKVDYDKNYNLPEKKLLI